jgi:hypothetical protein
MGHDAAQAGVHLGGLDDAVFLQPIDEPLRAIASNFFRIDETIVAPGAYAVE